MMERFGRIKELQVKLGLGSWLNIWLRDWGLVWLLRGIDLGWFAIVLEYSEA